MKELILKVTDVNWGEMSPGFCKQIEWKIYSDYTVDIEIIYVGKEKITNTKKITEKIYTDILTNIELTKNINKKVEAFDGNAWEFILYNSGNEVWKWNLDYIYGIETLENISQRLLTLINVNKVKLV